MDSGQLPGDDVSTPKSSTQPKAIKMCTQTGWTTFKIDYTWMVNGFSLYLQNSTDYTQVKSPKFFSPEYKNIPFYLGLYPKGKNEDGKDFVALFLNNSVDEATESRKILYNYKLSVVNEVNEKHSYAGLLIYFENLFKIV